MEPVYYVAVKFIDNQDKGNADITVWIDATAKLLVNLYGIKEK